MRIRVPRVIFDWLTLPRTLTIIAVVGVGYGWILWSMFRRGDETSIVLAVGASPVAAALMAPALIALVPELIGWVDERTWKPWQGRYYAFDDHQIRIVESRDRLWFSSRDVHAALRVKRRSGVLRSLSRSQCLRDDALGDTLSREGLAILFGRSTDRRVVRFLWWVERDVERPWKNRREGTNAEATVRSQSFGAGFDQTHS